MARTTTGKYVIEAVAKALDILETFGNTEGLTLNEISQQVGLTKSRVFRLLQTLAERGYVSRSTDGSRYKLGVKLLERAANVHRNVKELARSAMLQLQERFNETVNLSVLDDNGNVLYVDIVESSRPFRMAATVGCRLPSHLTSMGKAMLAYLHIDDSVSTDRALAAKLSAQATRALHRELERVREQGYAVDNEGTERGVACIGAPILDANRRPVAAMSVSGPAHRILAHEKKISEAVVAACQGISENLGFETPGRVAHRPEAGAPRGSEQIVRDRRATTGSA